MWINNKSINLRHKKRPCYRSFFNGDDRKEIYLIKLRIFLEISFEGKSDNSLLQALQTTLFLRWFRINPESLISDHLTFFPERLDKLNHLGIKDHGLVKI